MKVKMHSGCIGQELVALQKEEPPAPRCFCRKLIEFDEADARVKAGSAKWVVTKRTRGVIEVDCPLCPGMTDIEKKTCAQCKGTGKVMEAKVWEDYNNDIVEMSTKSIDEREKKYRLNTRGKTPRVATIEGKHILRAVVSGLKYASDRIEEYGRMIQEARAFVGPPTCCHRDDVFCERCKPGGRGPGQIPTILPEPVDDLEKHQGRKYDMGDPILAPLAINNEPGEEPEAVVSDPPRSTTVYGALSAVGLFWSQDSRYLELQNYSLKKIAEGDGQIGSKTVSCCGINWRRNDPRVKAALGETNV